MWIERFSRTAMFVLVVVFVLSAGEGIARDGRDIVGNYALTSASEQGDQVELTLTLRLMNYSGADITKAAVTLRHTTLYSFCSQSGCTDGQLPYAGLVQGTDGKLFGTTNQGGSNCVPSGGCGTIFSLSIGLGPFVKTLPQSGQVGQVIEILGTDLTGATSVTFNGTPARFTVDARTEITATVPTGATTGRIQVTTPGRTLRSAGPFVVQP